MAIPSFESDQPLVPSVAFGMRCNYSFIPSASGVGFRYQLDNSNWFCNSKVISFAQAKLKKKLFGYHSIPLSIISKISKYDSFIVHYIANIHKVGNRSLNIPCLTAKLWDLDIWFHHEFNSLCSCQVK